MVADRRHLSTVVATGHPNRKETAMTASPVPRPTQTDPAQWTLDDVALAARRGEHALIEQARQAGQLRDLLALPEDEEGADA